MTGKKFRNPAQINRKFLYSPNVKKEFVFWKTLLPTGEINRSNSCLMARLLALTFLLAVSTTAMVAQPDFNAVQDSTSEEDMGESRGQAAELDTELARVHFKQGKVGLTPEAQRELDRLIRLMENHPELIVNVFGHADDTGTIYRMQELSDLRAQMVKAYLIANGIPLDRIYSIGFGFRKPAVDSVTPAARAENRRVEIHIDYYNHK